MSSKMLWLNYTYINPRWSNQILSMRVQTIHIQIFMKEYNLSRNWWFRAKTFVTNGINKIDYNILSLLFYRIKNNQLRLILSLNFFSLNSEILSDYFIWFYISCFISPTNSLLILLILKISFVFFLYKKLYTG